MSECVIDGHLIKLSYCLTFDQIEMWLMPIISAMYAICGLGEGGIKIGSAIFCAGRVLLRAVYILTHN